MDIYNIVSKRPHVCILGAGATKATIPNGDLNGKETACLDNIIKQCDIKELIDKFNPTTPTSNFEDIFEEICSRPDCVSLKLEIENRLTQYFASFCIPETPTIYDYLIASLRGKDYIFSFNWDPLLIQTYQRVCELTEDLPLLVFLHGNVAMKICSKCKYTQSANNSSCCDCGCSDLGGSKLLFPIRNKDYTATLYLKTAKDVFLRVITSCSYLTIFGYSAPKSDSIIANEMTNAFESTLRRFDRIEIIDKGDREKIYNTWSPIINATNGHYNIVNTFWESSFKEFPRRTIEGYCKRYLKGWAGPSNMQLHECHTYEEFIQLFLPIIAEDLKGHFDTL